MSAEVKVLGSSNRPLVNSGRTLPSRNGSGTEEEEKRREEI
jgi:hypothetical protein